MTSGTVAVVTPHRQNRRQIARALHSGGIAAQFFDKPDVEAVGSAHEGGAPGIAIIDCDAYEPADTLKIARALDGKCSVVLLSSSADKSQLLGLIQQHDIGNLVAKHGAMTFTSRFTGVFRDNPAEQARFMSMVRGTQR